VLQLSPRLTQNLIFTQNEAIAIQPFDARIRRDAYITSIKYPFILGGTIAGTVVAVGDKVTKFQVGDRVVSDTPVYKKRETKYGGWQKYVVGRESISSNIGNAPFDQAVALPFPLQTAVGALHVYMGMELPSTAPASVAKEKVLIWGAGGSVGGYAVQFAKSVGYTGKRFLSSPAKVYLLTDSSDCHSVTSRI
jgi:NADPH:quinone reductase-like Zn-dependent oxidoreductase